jgi:hypothetical protein
MSTCACLTDPNFGTVDSEMIIDNKTGKKTNAPFFLCLLQDLPTFTTNMERFINDLRYYKCCNASLPSGSVNLAL